MHKIVFALLCLIAPYAIAKDMVEVKLPRKEFGRDVFIRGLLDRSPVSNGKVLLLFRGFPGIVKIGDTGPSARGPLLQEYFEEMIPILSAAGVATVTVDCPTDQWRLKCSDDYRSSQQHAEDVASLVVALKGVGDFNQVYVMGHSYGAVSSHWLSLTMGSTLSGVIHSSTQSKSPGFVNSDLAASMSRFRNAEVTVPYLYIHHKEDLCDLTPFDYAQRNAKDGALITVLGGDRSGTACGAGSFHGFAGRRPMVAAALVKWINAREVVPVVGSGSD